MKYEDINFGKLADRVGVSLPDMPKPVPVTEDGEKNICTYLAACQYLQRHQESKGEYDRFIQENFQRFKETNPLAGHDIDVDEYKAWVADLSAEYKTKLRWYRSEAKTAIREWRRAQQCPLIITPQ